MTTTLMRPEVPDAAAHRTSTARRGTRAQRGGRPAVLAAALGQPGRHPGRLAAAEHLGDPHRERSRLPAADPLHRGRPARRRDAAVGDRHLDHPRAVGLPDRRVRGPGARHGGGSDPDRRGRGRPTDADAADAAALRADPAVHRVDGHRGDPQDRADRHGGGVPALPQHLRRDPQRRPQVPRGGRDAQPDPSPATPARGHSRGPAAGAGRVCD